MYVYVVPLARAIVCVCLARPYGGWQRTRSRVGFLVSISRFPLYYYYYIYYYGQR